MPEKTEFARPSLTARKFLNQKKFNNNMTLRGRNMKKSELRNKLKRDIERYLKNGGKVTSIESRRDKKSLMLNAYMTAREKKFVVNF